MHIKRSAKDRNNEVGWSSALVELCALLLRWAAAAESRTLEANDDDVEDPVTAIRIVRPPDRAIEKSPVMF